MVRPDYLTFSVALMAFVYGGVGTAGWAQVTCLALAVVTAVAALSLWSQRDLWAVKRPQPAPPPAVLDGLDVAAPAPVSSGIFAPDFRNRRLFVPVGVIVVIAAGLWWRTTSVNHVPHVAGTRQLASGQRCRPTPLTRSATATLSACSANGPAWAKKSTRHRRATSK